MKINPWTLGLAAAGVVSLASAVQAEEATESVKTLVSSTTLSGYVNTSVHWNPGSSGSVANYSYGAGGAKDDGFNLDVIDLTFEKPLDAGEWAAGYKAELWFGPDVTTGLGNAVAAPANASSIGIKQGYVALRAPLGNGLDFKVGIFDTIIGYESANAPDNPNYTRSWGNSIEPTSHTGVLMSYKFNDIISASAGIANTHDAVINGRAPSPVGGQTRKTYMGAITLTAPDSLGFVKGGTLSAGVVDGHLSTDGFGPGALPDTTHTYVGVAVPTPIESLKVGAAWDHRNRDGLNDADAVAGYLTWQATEKLKVNLRGEYLDDGAGFTGFGANGVFADIPANVGNSRGAAAQSGAFAEVISTTVTVDYALWANVISRLEYRWDHDTSGGHHFAAARNNANLLALNVIYKF